VNDQVPALRQFAAALQSEQMKEQISKLLPPDVSYDRFTRTTMVAINTNPDVLQADRQSLYNAISRAAADGLMPDGREAALVVYSEKRGNGYIKAVRHMPMVEGIVKMMGKAGIKAYAASVYANDVIDVWNDDSGQHIKHKPEPFKPRGEMVGVYAVATDKDGTTYVETLTLEEIDRIRASSKSGDKGPWAAWYDRMAQKSALHRIKKRVPIFSAAIADSLRDPEEDLETPVEAPETAEAPPAEPAPSQRRPRGLQAVMDRAVVDEEPPMDEAPPATEEDMF
jgi:recombination protein RecT